MEEDVYKRQIYKRGKKMKVMSVFGTRPEAIKMCPLVKVLEATEGIESVVCLTGQHKEMLQQVIDIFGTKVKYNLNIMKPRQTLTTITSSILEKIEPVLIEEKPDIDVYKRQGKKPAQPVLVSSFFFA